jgi:hypothetical protein
MTPHEGEATPLPLAVTADDTGIRQRPPLMTTLMYSIATAKARRLACPEMAKVAQGPRKNNDSVLPRVAPGVLVPKANSASLPL